MLSSVALFQQAWLRSIDPSDNTKDLPFNSDGLSHTKSDKAMEELHKKRTTSKCTGLLLSSSWNNMNQAGDVPTRSQILGCLPVLATDTTITPHQIHSSLSFNENIPRFEIVSLTVPRRAYIVTYLPHLLACILESHINIWHFITSDSWVLSIVAQGNVIEFFSIPLSMSHLLLFT